MVGWNRLMVLRQARLYSMVGAVCICCSIILVPDIPLKKANQDFPDGNWLALIRCVREPVLSSI